MKTSIIKENVSKIRLSFQNILGIEKTIFIPASKADDLLNKGIWIDSSDIEGLLKICDEDYLLKPDISSYKDEVTGNGKIAYFNCSVYNSEGTLINPNYHQSIESIEHEAKEKGYNFKNIDELINTLFNLNKTEIIGHNYAL